MTELLYLTNSYLITTTATVTGVGDNYLILDQTIFYPQGGGQPSDKGIIKSTTGELKIKSVEYNGGNIKHVGTFSGTFTVGQSIDLQLDWPLRLKHMQWHTAGHLVDLVVRKIYPQLIPVRGMHGIGKKLFIEYEGTNELDLKSLNMLLNKLTKSQPLIHTQFITHEKLKKMANWLPPKLPISKKLRILSINDNYHIPDGGTQLKTGDEIWPIEITQVEHSDTSFLVHYTVTPPTNTHVDDSNHQSNLSSDPTMLYNQFKLALTNVSNPDQLEELRVKYLSKKHGLVTKLMNELPKLLPAAKRVYGPQLNQLKKDIKSKIHEQQSILKHENAKKLSYDITIPGTPQPSGRLHPTTELIRSLNSFFRYYGFSVAEGPEIENVDYNFRRLNLPEGHPATDLQDSLFVREPDILLRTHTSSIETRVLSQFHDQLPLRVVVPGKCYRNETSNMTNSAFFFQYQGFVVDQGVNIQNLKDMLTRVHRFLFGDDIVLRFRYKYYPEVSPGMGVDMQCHFCHGKGCGVCKYRGYIETLGSGMIHYNTLKACGIDPSIYSGYAFGMGLDRLVMSKYAINDIRKLYGGEIAYL